MDLLSSAAISMAALNGSRTWNDTLLHLPFNGSSQFANDSLFATGYDDGQQGHMPYDTEVGRVLFEFKEFYIHVHGYLSIVLCVFGLITNVLNIIVLTRKEMLTATNGILTGLAVADMLVMISYIPFAFHSYIRTNTTITEQYAYGWALFTMLHAHVTVIGHAISTWLTVSLAIWRYLSVKFPTESRNWLTMSSARWTIVMTWIVVPVFCLPVLMSFTVVEDYTVDMEPFYRVDWSDISKRHGELLKKTNFWVFSVGLKIAPCILLTYLSKALISALVEADKRKKRLKQNCYTLAQINVPRSSTCAIGEPTNGAAASSTNSSSLQTVKPTAHTPAGGGASVTTSSGQGDRTTRMLLAVLLLFLITEFPVGLLALLSGLIGESFFRNVQAPLGELMDILALTNSAINFILYCTMSKQFRQTFSKLFFL